MGNYKKKSVSQDFVNDISKCVNAYTSSYKAGATITEFGTNNKVVGIILSGEIDIIKEDLYGNRSILEKLTPLSIFAEQLTYYDNDYVYVKSKTDSTVIILNYDYINKRCARNCENHNNLISRINELLIKRSNQLSERLDILSRKTIEEKLMAYFKTLKKEDSNKIILPFSLSSLAEYLCIDRSNMMRELNKMEDKFLIIRHKSEIELLDD